MALGAIRVFLNGNDERRVIVLMWVIPIGAVAISVALVLVGAQLRPPERLVAIGEALFGRASGLSAHGRRRPGRDELSRMLMPHPVALFRPPLRQDGRRVFHLGVSADRAHHLFRVLQSRARDLSAGVDLALMALFRVPSHPKSRSPSPSLRLDRGLRARQPAAGSRRRARGRRVGLAVPVAGLHRRAAVRPVRDAGLQPVLGVEPTRSNQLWAQPWSTTSPGGRRRTGRSGCASPTMAWSRSSARSVLSTAVWASAASPPTYSTATADFCDGSMRRRPTSRRERGDWRTQRSRPRQKTPKHAVYTLPTNLSPNEVRRTFLRLIRFPFGHCRPAAALRPPACLADRYELQFNVLLSRPILLLAMVLIAANVSLRFSRSRNLGRMIISGVAVGFMLYVVMKIAWDLGSGGIVPPPLAAWFPAIVATLVGVTVLLHLEDG